MGHFGEDTQAHQFWQMNYRVSRESTVPQYMYTGFRDGAHWGRHTCRPVLADAILVLKEQAQDHNLELL